MTPLDQARATLDGVEPVYFLFVDGYRPGWVRTDSKKEFERTNEEDRWALYTREDVESLLQAQLQNAADLELRIRKQVLLEAAEVCHETAEQYKAENDWAFQTGAENLRDKFRRMADDLEGGKG